MAQINPDIPVIGNPVSTEDPKVKNALETIVAAVNSLDNANVASNADINGSKLLNGSVSAAKLTYGIDNKTAAYTLVAADRGKIITVNSATAVDVTINSSLGLSAGERIDVIQTGAGQVTFVASGTTVNGAPGLKIVGQYRAATVLCVGADSYIVIGALAA